MSNTSNSNTTTAASRASDAVVNPPRGLAPVGKVYRGLVGITSLAVLLSALATGAIAGLLAKQPILPLAGFELVVVSAGMIGLLWSRGRFGAAPSLGLLCVAACVAVASVLGYFGATGKIELANKSVIPLRMWLVGRLLAAAVLGALCVHLALRQDRRSYPIFLKGIAAAVPFVVIAAVVVLAWSRVDAVLGGWPTLLRVTIWTLAGVVSAVSICAGGHFLIRAFEIRFEPPAEDGDRATELPAQS